MVLLKFFFNETSIFHLCFLFSDSNEVTSPKLKSPGLGGPSQIPMIPGVPVVRELGTAGPSGSTSPMVRSPSVSRAHAHHGTGMPGDKRITSPKGAKMMRMSSGTDPRGTIKHVMNQKKIITHVK